MIKVRKGTQILDIPKSTYEVFYKPAGWVQIVKKSEFSPWEQELRSMSLAQLKKLAKEKDIEVAGASKKSLIEVLLPLGE